MGVLVFFAYLTGALVALLALFASTACRRALAPTNWVLRLVANGVFLRFRSYLNGDYPGEAIAALIPATDIAYVRAVTEKGTRIDGEGSKMSVTHRRL